MSVTQYVLVLCVVIAVSVCITLYIQKIITQQKQDAAKTVTPSEILAYSVELLDKINKMLSQYATITTESYKCDADIRAACISKTINIITRTLAEHNITIPVDQDVIQSIAILLVEKAIATLDLERSAKTIEEQSERICQLEQPLDDPEVENHADCESVNLQG